MIAYLTLLVRYSSRTTTRLTAAKVITLILRYAFKYPTSNGVIAADMSPRISIKLLVAAPQFLYLFNAYEFTADHFSRCIPCMRCGIMWAFQINVSVIRNRAHTRLINSDLFSGQNRHLQFLFGLEVDFRVGHLFLPCGLFDEALNSSAALIGIISQIPIHLRYLILSASFRIRFRRNLIRAHCLRSLNPHRIPITRIRNATIETRSKCVLRN